MLLKSAEVVLTLSSLLAVGYFFRGKNIIKKTDVRLLSFLAIYISVPSNIFVSTLTNFDKASLIEFAPSLFFPVIQTFILFTLSYLVAKIIKLPKTRFGVFANIFSFGNIGLLGLPVASSILGKESLVYSSMFFLSNTLIYWTFGVYLIKKDASIILGGSNTDSNFMKKLKEILSQLVSPTIITFIITIILVLLAIKPPEFLFNSVKYISSIGTPLSMIYLGCIIHDAKNIKFKYSIDLFLLSISRFVFAPLLMIFLLSFTNYDYDLKESFILYSSIAAMTQIGVVAGIKGADKEYAAYAIVSTIFLYPIGLLLFPILLKLI